MIFTLGHARTFCQDAIGSGVNPAGSKALGVINEATMHLINEGHWRHTIKPMQIRTYNNYGSMSGVREGDPEGQLQ